ISHRLHFWFRFRVLRLQKVIVNGTWLNGIDEVKDWQAGADLWVLHGEKAAGYLLKRLAIKAKFSLGFPRTTSVAVTNWRQPSLSACCNMHSALWMSSFSCNGKGQPSQGWVRAPDTKQRRSGLVKLGYHVYTSFKKKPLQLKEIKLVFLSFQGIKHKPLSVLKTSSLIIMYNEE
ncbi:hypothetical protein Celaphus_00016526, partial [Cervus elaphus hippelaphus]